MLASGYTYLGQRYYVIASGLVLIALQSPLPTSQTPRPSPCNHIALPRRFVGRGIDGKNRLRHDRGSSSNSCGSRCGSLGSCSSRGM